MLEMAEYLFAQTSAAHALRVATSPNGHDPLKDAADHIRGAFRLHRFNVFTWLMQNGAKLPVRLVDDRIHPEVGNQGPDRPVNPV